MTFGKEVRSGRSNFGRLERRVNPEGQNFDVLGKVSFGKSIWDVLRQNQIWKVNFWTFGEKVKSAWSCRLTRMSNPEGPIFDVWREKTGKSNF